MWLVSAGVVAGLLLCLLSIGLRVSPVSVYNHRETTSLRWLVATGVAGLLLCLTSGWLLARKLTAPVSNRGVSGCSSTAPEQWVQPTYQSQAALATFCTLDVAAIKSMSIDQLENATYTVQWSATGSDIYDDVTTKTNKLFYNYGDYIAGNGTGHCQAEPTRTLATYNTTTDLVSKGLLLTDGSSTLSLVSKAPEGGTDETPRDSVRIHCVPSFAFGLFVFEVLGTPDDPVHTSWPAIWMTSPYDCFTNTNTMSALGQWGSSTAEIDVLEQVCSKQNHAALHVPCHNTGDSIQVQAGGGVSGPGYYVLEWTPKYIKMYSVPLEEGETLFAGNSLDISSLAAFNKTSSEKTDPPAGTTPYRQGWIGQDLRLVGGTDVVDGRVSIDPTTAGSNDWRRVGGEITNSDIPRTIPCQPAPGVPLRYLDPLKQKKHAQYVALLNPEVTGGMSIVFNVATAGSFCPDVTGSPNTPRNPVPQVLTIGKTKVYQI